jgi:hypothetical protein
MNPCFPDADAYVRYITRDQAWASMSKIEVLSFLWGRPIIVWSSDGLPKPGLIGFVEGVPPINIVYSNGNHYDALIGSDSDASLVAATAALHQKGRMTTLFARANVVDLACAQPPSRAIIDAIRPSMVLPPLASESSVPKRSMVPPSVAFESSLPKRKAELQSIRPAKKGSHRVDGVRKAS